MIKELIQIYKNSKLNNEKPECIFAETLIFNEGWLIRSVLEKWLQRKGISKFKFLPFPGGVKIYSKGQLYTPFREGCSEKWERNTEVDGIVGNFSIEEGTKSGIRLDKDFRYLAVFEAKMYSGLAKSITHAENYSQISRTIACTINSVLKVLKVNEIPHNRIYYIVTYPNDNKKITPQNYPEKFIKGEIEERIKIYNKHKTIKKNKEFDIFRKHWRKVLESIEVQFVTWEDIFKEIKDQDIKTFYVLCKKYNK